MVPISCPPDSVRDIECPVFYEGKCSKCISLKWQLSRRKRGHAMLTLSQRKERQCSSSHVPFDVLSPHREKARFESMKETIHSLKTRAEYF